MHAAEVDKCNARQKEVVVFGGRGGVRGGAPLGAARGRAVIEFLVACGFPGP